MKNRQNEVNILKNYTKIILTTFIFCFLITISTKVSFAGTTYTVKVNSGYLALRSQPSYNTANEIGKLYTGDTVEVDNPTGDKYWYVYSPKYGTYGYVNSNYLTGGGSYSGTAKTVSVSSGYLALRSAPAYSTSNEIGQLYSGDTVYVQSTYNSTYCYVYSPKYNAYGYVNSNYLTGGGSYSGTAKTVSVSSGYLALRSAPAYSTSNEIGQLYSGDTVYVQSTYNSTYCYVYSPTYDAYGYVNSDYLR